MPIEIIEQFLTNDTLKIQDIVNFSRTCSHFHDVVCNNNAIWKLLYIRSLPEFVNAFEQYSVSSWYTEVKYYYQLMRNCHDILADMSPKFYKRYELSDLDLVQWKDMMKERPLAYHYLIKELMNIVNNRSPIYGIHVVPINTPGNLTYRYYARKVLRFLRQEYLTKEWETYINLPPEEQILERGAVFIAQWCQPTVDVSLANISKQLDVIAGSVREVLRDMHSDHPIFSTSIEVQNSWRTRNLTTNKWAPNKCRQIMDAIAIVLYKHLGFYGNNEMYYIPENSYINIVLEKRQGLPITLSIVYESIARRLGIRCEPISFPAHFLLRWTYGPSEEDSFYIDVFKGNVMIRSSCPHARNSNNQKRTLYAPSTARHVTARMANNLELSGRHHEQPNGRITRLRSVLELSRVINPMDLTCILNLAKLYMLYNMDVSELSTYLANQEFDIGRKEQAQQIVQMLQDHEAHHKVGRNTEYAQVEVAPRTSEMKFAVGMIMRHLRLGYICVIYDWDPICLASSDWQDQMNVHRLSMKDKQPFYNVLVEDGSHRYVAQENIVPIANPSSLLVNEDLGSHFSHFYETHFVPNAEKEKEYPEDSSIRHMYHEELVFGLK